MSVVLRVKCARAFFAGDNLLFTCLFQTYINQSQSNGHVGICFFSYSPYKRYMLYHNNCFILYLFYVFSFSFFGKVCSVDIL